MLQESCLRLYDLLENEKKKRRVVWTGENKASSGGFYSIIICP